MDKVDEEAVRLYLKVKLKEIEDATRDKVPGIP